MWLLVRCSFFPVPVEHAGEHASCQTPGARVYMVRYLTMRRAPAREGPGSGLIAAPWPLLFVPVPTVHLGDAWRPSH